MKPPPFEVADIIRAHGDSFVDRNRSWLTWQHLRVLFAIEHCRPAALGCHRDRCHQCGHEALSFNSCRSRHCPKCPVKYVHVVFTIPHELSWLELHNKKLVYDLLFPPAPPRSSRLRPIHGTSARTSASSVSCTPGDRTSKFIRISTA